MVQPRHLHHRAVVSAIRRAQPHDIPAMAALARAAYAPYAALLGFEPPAMAPDFGSGVAAERVWLAVGAQGRPSGYVIAYPEGGAWHVENLAVAPECQGEGLGRALLAEAEAAGRAAGYARATLYTNRVMAGPLALYPRLGYLRTHEQVRHCAAGRLELVYFAKDL